MPRAPLRRRNNNRYSPFPRHGQKIPNSNPARLELEKKLAHKRIGERPNDSDDSDGLVVKGNGRRGGNTRRQEIYASGGVGKGDKPGTFPSRAQRRKNMVRAGDDILAKAEQEARSRGSSESSTTRAQQRKTPAAGDANKVANAPAQDSAPAPAPKSSAVKPSGRIVRSAQPTPTRENSILGTLKPRRRQPSILQELDQDSSSIGLDDEEHFLPDAESTPLNLFGPRSIPSTPATNAVHTTSSKKRKLDSARVFQPEVEKVNTSPREGREPSATSPSINGTHGPSSPLLPVSTRRISVRKSSHKSREKADDDDEDIMALPRSSSSVSGSPAPPSSAAPTRKSRQAPTTKPAPAMATGELQALMPKKRRRTGRVPKGTQADFDIAVDSDSPGLPQSDGASENDESTFLPPKAGRKPRRKQPSKKFANNGGSKAGNMSKRGNSAAVAGSDSQSKQSTRNLTTTKAPVLTPSTSTSIRRNRSTKSPSQLSTVNSSSLNSNPERRTRGRLKPHGGSLHAGQDPTDGGDKENINIHDGSPCDSEIAIAEKTSVEPTVIHKNMTPADDTRTAATSNNKWADIDAWDLDFEDVEVMTGSSGSSPLRLG
ncbi:hypothetical protein ABEF95_016772 [Exophiala dermatitidis]